MRDLVGQYTGCSAIQSILLGLGLLAWIVVFFLIIEQNSGP
jgi:hypothetical protein